MRLLEQAVLAILAEGNKNSGCNPSVAKQHGTVCGRPPKKASRKFGKPKPPKEYQKEFYRHMADMEGVHDRMRPSDYESYMNVLEHKAARFTRRAKGFEGEKHRLKKFLQAIRDWGGNPTDLQRAADDIMSRRRPQQMDTFTKRHALELLDTINNAPETKRDLYRGIKLEGKRGPVRERLTEMMKKGDTIDLGLSSFSESSVRAREFSGPLMSKQKGTVPVVFQLEKGAKGINISGIIQHELGEYGEEAEWLSSGKFKIKGVHTLETNKYFGMKGKPTKYLLVTLAQKAVFGRKVPL